MPRKYVSRIQVIRAWPQKSDPERFLVWLKIGPLTIRDVRFNRRNGSVRWPSKAGGYPIVVPQKGYSTRVRRRILEYLATEYDDRHRTMTIEPEKLDVLCLYCHEPIEDEEGVRGEYHAECVTDAKRELEDNARELAVKVGPDKAAAWLQKQKVSRGWDGQEDELDET